MQTFQISHAEIM